ncbi:hypothetical protein COBT_000510 [Conglomerata obtusa]
MHKFKRISLIIWFLLYQEVKGIEIEEITDSEKETLNRAKSGSSLHANQPESGSKVRDTQKSRKKPANSDTLQNNADASSNGQTQYEDKASTINTGKNQRVFSNDSNKPTTFQPQDGNNSAGDAGNNNGKTADPPKKTLWASFKDKLTTARDYIYNISPKQIFKNGIQGVKNFFGFGKPPTDIKPEDVNESKSEINANDELNKQNCENPLQNTTNNAIINENENDANKSNSIKNHANSTSQETITNSQNLKTVQTNIDGSQLNQNDKINSKPVWNKNPLLWIGTKYTDVADFITNGIKKIKTRVSSYFSGNTVDNNTKNKSNNFTNIESSNNDKKTSDDEKESETKIVQVVKKHQDSSIQPNEVIENDDKSKFNEKPNLYEDDIIILPETKVEVQKVEEKKEPWYLKHKKIVLTGSSVVLISASFAGFYLYKKGKVQI